MSTTQPKFDPREMNARRKLSLLMGKRKWREAYSAVDELLFVRARAVHGCAAGFVRTPATVTDFKQWKARHVY